MAGKARLEDQDDAIRSACRLPIYQAAKEILKHHTKQDRAEALLVHPDAIRPHIEAEVRRLWSIDR